jgi:tetratricopeptide (TPR) repeat protein
MVMMLTSVLSTTKAPDIVCLYAHDDKSMYIGIEKRMLSLQRRGYIHTWGACEISLEKVEQDESATRIDDASMIFVLVSVAFLHNNYCSTAIIQHALERHASGEARVVPILLPYAELQGTPFEGFTFLPGNEEAFMHVQVRNKRERACFALSVKVRELLEGMIAEPPAPREPKKVSAPYYLPRSRNPYFTGREDILRQLDRRLAPEKNTAWSSLDNMLALTGPAGSGKTQIAIEFAHRRREQHSIVLWASAHSRMSLIQDYAYIAYTLQLLELIEEGQEQMIAAVRQWLDTHENWLLILDDVTDPDLLQEFLPLISKGCVLITASDSTPALRALACTIPVEDMSPEEGILLLLRRAGMLPDQTPLEYLAADMLITASGLVQMLGGSPLTLDVAGAYIAETDCSLKEYRRRYNVQQKRQVRREKRNPWLADLDPQETAILLSFNEITPPVSSFLKLCAFLMPDNIPAELCKQKEHDLPAGLHMLANNSIATDEALATLSAYGLVQRSLLGTFSVSPVIQRLILKQIADSDQRLWSLVAISVANNLFPEEYERPAWPLCDRLMPLAQACRHLIERWQITSFDAFVLLSRVMMYLRKRMRIAEAESFYKVAFSILEGQFGPEHALLPPELWVLAELTKLQKKYDESETFLQRALAIHKNTYGPVHWQVARSLNDLGELAHTCSNPEQARRYYKRALVMYEMTVGTDHQDVAEVLVSLGLLDIEKGDFESAAPLLKRALAINERELEGHDPRLVTNLSSLAICYYQLNKDELADPLVERAQAALIPPDRDLGVTYTDVGVHYMHEGELDKAELLLTLGLRFNEERLGPDDPQVAVTLNNLGSLCRKQEKDEQAEEFFRRALAIFERNEQSQKAQGLEPGKASLFAYRIVQNVAKAAALNNLACLYRDQRKIEKAERFFKQARELLEQTLGPDHPEVATVLINYAELLWMQRRHNEALKMEAHARAIQEKQQS